MAHEKTQMVLMVVLSPKVSNKETLSCVVAWQHGTVGQTPWKPFLLKLKNHLKTFKMHQKIISHLNFVYNLSTNDKNSKIVHAEVTCEV